MRVLIDFSEAEFAAWQEHASQTILDFVEEQLERQDLASRAEASYWVADTIAYCEIEVGDLGASWCFQYELPGWTTDLVREALRHRVTITEVERGQRNPSLEERFPEIVGWTPQTPEPFCKDDDQVRVLHGYGRVPLTEHSGIALPGDDPSDILKFVGGVATRLVPYRIVRELRAADLVKVSVVKPLAHEVQHAD